MVARCWWDGVVFEGAFRLCNFLWASAFRLARMTYPHLYNSAAPVSDGCHSLVCNTRKVRHQEARGLFGEAFKRAFTKILLLHT